MTTGRGASASSNEEVRQRHSPIRPLPHFVIASLPHCLIGTFLQCFRASSSKCAWRPQKWPAVAVLRSEAIRGEARIRCRLPQGVPTNARPRRFLRSRPEASRRTLSLTARGVPRGDWPRRSWPRHRVDAQLSAAGPASSSQSGMTARQRQTAASAPPAHPVVPVDLPCAGTGQFSFLLTADHFWSDSLGLLADMAITAHLATGWIADSANPPIQAMGP